MRITKSMTGEQYDALVKLMRGIPESKANQAARRVLIDGITQVAAANEFNLKQATVSRAVKRYAEADKLIRDVYGR
ncbi:transcriptional regulator KorA [Pseudomonas sp. UMAB-40]|uniref:transcriptional regulator KorA n=1 Tax=Pseudomonas sp. UMAB-40 TaxID=1365407 RepID=UPI00214B9B55|nr:transcriptional regulator KorA [Pseudomonas sp. UMAB-40]